MTRLRIAIVPILILITCTTIVRAAETVPWDVLVIAPHSDDEAIGCTGVILRAVEKKQRVGVVIVTAGDGFPKAAAAFVKKELAQLTPEDFLQLAALRQRHTLQALPKLGMHADDILFLGYPDGGLKTIYEAQSATPYRSPLTGQSETYGNEARDYHHRTHGRAAPYTRQAVINDLAEIIRARKPGEIYVTHAIDTHGDHRATYWFLRDAAGAADFRGSLWTYVVHGRAPEEAPGRVLTLTASAARKRATIEIYQTGVSPIHDDLARQYTLPEERFWLVNVAPADK